MRTALTLVGRDSNRQTADSSWGVWDRHLRVWVVPPLWTDREAWVRLLEADSLHPWELEVRREHPNTGKAAVECDDCTGHGTCWACDQTCPTCQGEGVLSE